MARKPTTTGNLTIGCGLAATDYTLTFNGETNDGIITWMEDEDYFKYSDGILMSTAEQIYFRDTGIFLASNDAGVLDIDSATRIDCNIGTTAQINLVDGKFAPTTDSDIDLGDTTHYFKDAFIDTVTTSLVVINQTSSTHLRLTGDPANSSPTDGDFWYTGTALKMMNGTKSTIIIQEGTFTPSLNGFTVVGDAPALIGIYRIVGNMIYFVVTVSAGSGGNTSVASVGATSNINGYGANVAYPSSCNASNHITGTDLGGGALITNGAAMYPATFGAQTSAFSVSGWAILA